MTDELHESAESVSDNSTPAITFESLRFSDGTVMTLGPSDVIAFVGPNNAGKSAALRDLDNSLTSANAHRKVIPGVELRKTGNPAAITQMMQRNARRFTESGQIYLGGLGFRIPEQQIAHYWEHEIGILKPFFRVFLSTEARINDSNPTEAIDYEIQDPHHPIHLLFADDRLETRISNYFRRAFGTDLILDRGGGRRLPLRVGIRPQPNAGEDRVSHSYVQRLRAQTEPLQEQGDGMRSFVSILLHLLAPGTPTLLFLDEPEAFLHPPQARLIGEFIARERPSGSQLFIATHSSDVLLGLLQATPENLRVVRLQRDGGINRTKELDKAQAREISADPLMKYSGVLSGIFHQRVIITESDADAMFYGALLDLPDVHGEVAPDVLFVQAGGKHRMAALAAALGALDVPVDVIADFDVLNDVATVRRLVQSLGGNSDRAAADAGPLKSAIEQHKPWLNSLEVANEISGIIAEAPSTGEFPRDLRTKIEAVFRKASPWDAIKVAGESAIPSGQPTTHYRSLRSYLSGIGFWIVPAGEVEGFCKAVGGHGPKWTQRVLEQYELATAPELQRARDFVSEIWKRELKA